MKKYENIIEQLEKSLEEERTPLNDLYMLGICHAVSSIALNDNTITREQFKQIDNYIDEIVKLLLKF